jgi:glycosyltransferase involved in cell wall biosynthesis
LTRKNFILFLNRLVPEKGCHLLIEAFRELKTDKKLFIAGDGKFSENYKRGLHRWRSDKILFGGHVDQQILEELYSNCYLYVLPSLLEGVSQAAIQALSYGKCVLASDIKENLDAMGDMGFTFRNNDVSDLKDKLQMLLNHRSRVEGQDERRRDFVRKNFSWDHAADCLEELFFDCLNGKRNNRKHLSAGLSEESKTFNQQPAP